VPAAGCSDLGNGTVTLPAPFSRVTQTCSNDNDCSGVSADINVGEMLRKLTGINSIKDGAFKYKMNRCASVKLISDIDCGVCVPCKDDNDCDAIDIAQVTGDILGPIGSIAARILLDQVFGPGEKKINMYCTNVFGQYGACVPCSNPLSACGKGKIENPNATTCPHGVCKPGDALATTCDSGCAGKVCADDPYCCSDAWDRTCVERVERLCDPERTCADQDSCEFKKAGWYCSEKEKFGSYRCEGAGETSIAEGFQCQPNQFCHRMQKDAIKTTAKLAASGKPQCFSSAQ
jgi:hypothetical protein